MDPVALALEALPKTFAYAGVMLCVGACVARGLFRVRVAHRLLPSETSTFEPALARLAAWSSLLLVAALVMRAWGHTAVAFGFSESFNSENLRTIAWESQWGEGWQWQIAAAIVLAIAAQLLRNRPDVGWTLTGLAAVVLCYQIPRLGHAAGEPARVLLHGSHILGAGIWVGTLGAVVLVSRISRETAGTQVRLLSQFWPVAFCGSALLVVTGLVAVWLYVGSLDLLVTTTYGRILLLKLFLVSDVATLGFLNWRHFRSLDARRSQPARATLVTLEAALAFAVVVVTAILTETEHP